MPRARKQIQTEIAKYDWCPWGFERTAKGTVRMIPQDNRWRVLIYQGRKPDGSVDAGVQRAASHKRKEDDPLYVLGKSGKLVGQALLDFEDLYKNDL